MGTVVKRLPYTQRIHSMINNQLLGLETDQSLPLDEEDGTTVDGGSCPSTPTMVVQEEGSRTLSPKEKIHNKLLDNRNEDVKPSLELNFIYSDTCDDFSDLASSPINKIKDYKQAYEYNPVISSIAEEEEEEEDGEIERIVEAAAEMDLLNLGLGIYPSTDSKQVRVQQYLEEQNEKFDTLINNNLEVVIEQQDKYPDEPTDEDTVADLMNEFMNLENLGLTGKAKFLGKVVKFTSKKVWDYSIPSRKTKEVEETEPEEPVVDTKDDAFDEIVGNLDNQDKLKLMKALHKDLLKLEDDELYQLMQDEDSNHELMEMVNKINKPQSGTKNLMIDKFEILLILSIKLFFLAIKFSIPLAYLIYDKFVNNSIFLFNNRNFDKLIDANIKLMTYLEAKLNNNYLNNFKYGSKPDEKELERFYNDLTNDFNTDDNKMFSKVKVWLPLVNKMFNDDKSTKKPNYARDPRYAKFFSKNLPLNQDLSKYDLRYNRSVESFKTANYGMEETEGLSLFRVAEQFVDEF